MRSVDCGRSTFDTFVTSLAKVNFIQDSQMNPQKWPVRGTNLGRTDVRSVDCSRGTFDNSVNSPAKVNSGQDSRVNPQKWPIRGGNLGGTDVL